VEPKEEGNLQHRDEREREKREAAQAAHASRPLELGHLSTPAIVSTMRTLRPTLKAIQICRKTQRSPPLPYRPPAAAILFAQRWASIRLQTHGKIRTLVKKKMSALKACPL